jgi:hypothetical protein
MLRGRVLTVRDGRTQDTTHDGFGVSASNSLDLVDGANIPFVSRKRERSGGTGNKTEKSNKEQKKRDSREIQPGLPIKIRPITGRNSRQGGEDVIL